MNTGDSQRSKTFGRNAGATTVPLLKALVRKGLLKQLTKAVLERSMGAEMTHHLGCEKGEASGRGSGNSRNGQSRTTNVNGIAEYNLRKVIKTRASFPNEESALKLIYLAIKNVSRRWRPAFFRTSMKLNRTPRVITLDVYANPNALSPI